MNSVRTLITGLLGAALLTSCETTGDPTQGGLFGWSETKAKQRIAEREVALQESSGELSRERDRGRGLHLRKQAGARRLAAAPARPSLRGGDFDRLIREVETVEREAPTAAGSSRARRLRDEILAARSDPALTGEQRVRLIRDFEQRIVRLRAALTLPRE